MRVRKAFVFALLPLLMGCAPKAVDGDVTITDMQGREVTYNSGKISRVICLGAGALRYYSYIGDITNIIAVEKIDSAETFGVGAATRPYYMANYETLKELPVIKQGGPMNQSVSPEEAEKILAANPDIIVSFLSAEINTSLQEMVQIPVIGLNQGSDGIFDQKTQQSLELLGKVFKKTSRATELINYVNTCKADFDSLTTTTESYYFGGIGNWGQTSMLGSMIGFPVSKFAKVNDVVDTIGLKDKDGNQITRGQGTADLERILSVNPDKIFMDTAGINGFISDYKKEGNAVKYDALKAFESGETYLLMPYNAYFSNLEIQLMSTYYVASVAHSNFTINLEEKMNEITNKFLGKDLYNEIKEHTYGMGGYQKVNLKELANK